MANAIKTLFRWQWWRDDALDRSPPSKEVEVETTSELFFDNTQIVGTTHELMAVADVTDDAMAIVENLHATATVQIGVDDGGVFVPVVDIPAASPAAVLPVVSTLAATYLQSSVASTPVRVTLIKIAA